MFRRNKYNAKKVLYDGIKWDSQAELKRYIELKRLQAAHEIAGLEAHVPYDLCVLGKKVCRYIPDFRYTNKAGQTIIEDVKGMKTDVYKLKKKLFEIVHAPLTITEIIY